MIGRNITFIAKADIDALVADAVQEGRTLDYKAQLPGNRDEDKREFLADVSSFANAAGGDIVFGVAEQKDADGRNTGVPTDAHGLSCNPDQECLRMESLIRDGIQPRLPGVQVTAIDGFADGPVLVLRIPRSWIGPHMVTFRNSSRFYSRTSAGKHQLDVMEIGEAFRRVDSRAETIRRFRNDRIARIVARETPVPLNNGPAIAMHVCPVDTSEADPFDLSTAWETCSSLRLLCGHGSRHRNFDGIAMAPTPTDCTVEGYLQIFRDGAIESVDTDMLGPAHHQNSERKQIASIAFEQCLIEALDGYLGLYRSMAREGAFAIFLAFLGVRGYTMTQSARFFGSGRCIERDDLILPEIVIDDLAQVSSQVLRPAFDMIWQACGYSQSRNYNEGGQWSPQQ